MAKKNTNNAAVTYKSIPSAASATWGAKNPDKVKALERGERGAQARALAGAAKLEMTQLRLRRAQADLAKAKAQVAAAEKAVKPAAAAAKAALQVLKKTREALQRVKPVTVYSPRGRKPRA